VVLCCTTSIPDKFAMLCTPDNTPCRSQVLVNSTNVQPRAQNPLIAIPLPTPPEDVPSKRRFAVLDETPTKRPRLMRLCGPDNGNDTDDVAVIKGRARHTMFGIWKTSSVRPPTAPLQAICMPLSMLVSSWLTLVYPQYLLVASCNPLYHHTSPTYTNATPLLMILSSHLLTLVPTPMVGSSILSRSEPQNCCSGAKSGRAPVLAVATEEGSVIILNTTGRRSWECGTFTM
jgi:denticleless